MNKKKKKNDHATYKKKLTKTHSTIQSTTSDREADGIYI